MIFKKDKFIRQRTLFCIIGNLRGGDLPYRSFAKNFGNWVDLALCVGNTYKDSPWRDQAKYIWEIDESDPKIWENIYDSVSTDWRNQKHVSNLWGPYQGLRGSGMINFSFRQKLYENLIKLPVEYERYVLTRADHFYTSDYLPPVRPNTIYLPEGEEYGGVTDRFSVGDRAVFLKSLQIIAFVIHNPDKHNNVEKYLKEFYTSLGFKIVQYARNMYTIGRIGEQTRWTAVTDKAAPYGEGQYFLKYPEEYALINKSKINRFLSRFITRVRRKIKFFFINKKPL